ncbi:MAG: carboxyltransferase domain-containing protein [Actinomycetota bacterium]|nr:carboxyltransferase domain-containing protein [Actinomycetota bacterium]
MLTFEAFGEAALFFRSPQAGEVEAASFRLAADPPAYITDVACSRRTGLVAFDPALAGPDEAEAAVQKAAEDAKRAPIRPRREVLVRVVLDGQDLAELLEGAHAGVEEFADELTMNAFPVAHLGFAPGFVYLDGLSERFRRPRRASPRTRVPAGAVAIGGPYLGIYGTAAPGGWNLVGTTHQKLFDEHREPPMELAPGDSVRFSIAGESDTPPLVEEVAGFSDPPAQGALEVLEADGAAWLEDGGRRCSGIWAVPHSGAADPWTHRLANLLVGNQAAAPAIEIPLGRIKLRALAPLHLATAGDGLQVSLDGRPMAAGHCFPVAPGQIIEISASPDSTYGYVAVAGGFQARRWFGSASHDRLSGFGPTPLESGQRLPVLPPTAPPKDHLLRSQGGPASVRVVAGPHLEHFSGEERDLLANAEFNISPSSSRVGVRLDGAGFAQRERRTLEESEPLALGAIQVPPGGQPIVMLADHPVTGGYPVIATVILADLDRITQPRPGSVVRFAYVDAEQARSAYRNRLAAQSNLAVGSRPFEELKSTEY